MDERDFRLQLLNTLLTTPHRDLHAIHPIHQKMIEGDPRFYVRLAAWYAERGDVRDHKEMFVINLCLSSFEGHREVGLALLGQLPPYELARIVDFIKGRRAKAAKPGRKPTLRGGKESREKAIKGGLGKNIPRSMRNEIIRYLRERESDNERLDNAILYARKAIKRLYAGLHIEPSERAQAILFDDNPPEDSSAYAVKQIAKAETPAEQARAIAQHGIPYRIAATLVKQVTPMVMAALIDRMSPQEVINNINSLKARGALDNQDLKKLIGVKLEAAKDDKRVSAYKAKVALKTAGITGDLADQLDAVTDAQVKAKGRIKRPTALLVDKSASMELAIEVGRQLGAMISSICEDDLFVYAFDTMPYPIEVKGESLTDWENSMAGINAGGATSCGVPLEWMRKQKQRVEQIIMVTDEYENTGPRFADAYQAYAKELDTQPDIILVKVGQAGDLLEKACQDLGASPSVFEFRGDYYALTNLIPLLTRPSMMELLMEILQYPLPQRRAA